MTDTYFKAVRPDGRDFRTGKIDYLAEGIISHPNTKPGSDDAFYYLSVSTSPTDCTGFSWPARLLEVEPVGDVWTPHASSLPNKRAVSALRVVGELDPLLLFGNHGQQIIDLIARARVLTSDEGTRLAAAWAAAWAAARAAYPPRRVTIIGPCTSHLGGGCIHVVTDEGDAIYCSPEELEADEVVA